ncbi:replicative DNA helicase [Oribacterium sp. P9]|jgi:replicative DNA helicase|uniref:replicative DNA helicase n=1 Tax=unclassified Oribacterium TaxID=2629782 RepID=UPI002A798480|nr:replicative DNA helicase [Oribacterium sp.]MDD6519720.1 replicative DNA helicase [Oribacterium sp.]MDY2853910.1 replicative DNA helicase [Oliverpabstia sp.]MEE1377922.1 replicative DNA helicase [Oribacterium sp.]
MAENNENILTRVVPHSQEAEQSVIGAMLRDKDAVSTAAEMLRPEDFYQKQYSLMFDAMTQLYQKDQPVDLVTLSEKLKATSNIPPEVYDIAVIRDIVMSVPTSANVKSYCTIVKEKSILRTLIRTNEDIANMCYSGTESADTILNETEQRIFKLLETRNTGDSEDIATVAMKVLENIQEAAQNGGQITGIPTGFKALDYKTAGLQRSDLILVAARPSMGKTAFVLNILDNVGVRQKKPCMIFSLEMSREQLVNRMLSMESLVDADKLRKGSLTDEDWGELINAVDRVADANITIDDTPGITVGELRSKCRKQKLEKGLDLVIIDYLQLMSGGGRGGESRQQEISEISRSLKAVAREMKCPVIALSQLSRAVEQRPDHRPMLSDLRESGAIEQDADIVMFLYRDEYYNKDTEHPHEAEVIIAKQRNGPIGTVILGWQAEYTRFVNAALDRDNH